MSNIVSSVGKRVRQLRTQSRMTQEQLAERSEISVSFLSMIERGERSPHLETLERLALGLEVPIEELFRGAAAAAQQATEAPVADGRTKSEGLEIKPTVRDGVESREKFAGRTEGEAPRMQAAALPKR